jgi:hypothetical protein
MMSMRSGAQKKTKPGIARNLNVLLHPLYFSPSCAAQRYHSSHHVFRRFGSFDRRISLVVQEYLRKKFTPTRFAIAEDVSTIVIDVGTNTTKAGYAGEDHPRFVIPSVRDFSVMAI